MSLERENDRISSEHTGKMLIGTGTIQIKKKRKPGGGKTEGCNSKERFSAKFLTWENGDYGRTTLGRGGEIGRVLKQKTRSYIL